MVGLGKFIVGFGIILVVVGLLLWFAGDKFSWFGHLPGDIRIERDGLRIYVPITSMIIVSIVLSLVLTLLARFFR